MTSLKLILAILCAIGALIAGVGIIKTVFARCRKCGLYDCEGECGEP